MRLPYHHLFHCSGPGVGKGGGAESLKWWNFQKDSEIDILMHIDGINSMCHSISLCSHPQNTPPPKKSFLCHFCPPYQMVSIEVETVFKLSFNYLSKTQ